MFNKIMIYLALLGMSLSALLSTVSSTTVEFNATNKSENVSLVTTSVDYDKSLPNSKESDNKSTKKNSNSIIDSFSSFSCMLTLYSYLHDFLHNFIIECLISYETKKR